MFEENFNEKDCKVEGEDILDESKHSCDCGEDCQCNDDCDCENDCQCGDDCENDCQCKEEKCNEGCTCGQEEKRESEYLDMARRVQADFDNFRRHAFEDIKKAKIDGQASVIEVFLPCLDTFKEAKKNISDENVLKGVEMIENKIIDALKTLGVEKFDSIGQVYNPHLHNVIAVMKDESKENDIILEEYQAGYKFNDKVLRYAKVIVNKKED